MNAPSLILFLTRRQWLIGLGSAASVAAALWPLYAGISVWVGVAVFIASLTAYHMVFASRFIVAFPHIAILISLLQYVLAAWVSAYFPPTNATYEIGRDMPAYLAYAGPAVLAVFAGWAVSLVKIKPIPLVSIEHRPGLLLELDLLLGAGLVAIVLGYVIHIPSISFVFGVAANLRYFAVYARMLAREPGWGWRLALVFGTEVVFAVESTMFHPLLLWTCWSGAVWLYCFRPRARSIFLVSCFAVLLLPALQQAKWRVRGGEDYDIFEGPERNALDETLTKSGEWFRYLGESFWQTITFELDTDFIADSAVRYNQGWIVTRVMSYVPVAEPYADGETIETAIYAALVPRIFAPDKIRSGGQEYMARFAGIVLNETTAMNIGYVAEMYANFGMAGGVLGCGIYSLCFGLIFRWFCKRALRSPIWWAMVPFVFFSALKAEDGIADAIGWATKSCYVLIAVYLLCPTLRAVLSGSPMRQDPLSPRRASAAAVPALMRS